MIKARMKETIINKADFSYFNSTVTFLFEASKISRKNLSCNVLLVDVLSVVGELLPKKL